MKKTAMIIALIFSCLTWLRGQNVVTATGGSGVSKDFTMVNSDNTKKWVWSHRASFEAESLDAWHFNGVSWLQAMSLKTNGLISMGASTPLAKLHVEGTGATNAKILIRGTSETDPSLELGSQQWPNVESGEGFFIKYRNSVGETILNNVFAESDNALRFQSGGTDRMVLKSNGNVGIGTMTTNGYKLAVNGTIGAREVNVNSSTWSDYVFAADYKLPSLESIERYIQQHQRLPEVPSAKEVEENGVKVGEMSALLLKKIEELTLHLIEKNKEIDALQEEMKTMNKKMEAVQKSIPARR